MLTHYSVKWWERDVSPSAPVANPVRRIDMTKSIEERFWAKVEKTDDCWLWTGATFGDGYGNCSRLRAHRVSWELANGPVPGGLCVLHHCDRPLCVRPRHLFLGTRKDNSDDKIAKGRHYWGHPSCPQGHEMTAANTYRCRSATPTGKRRCRACLATASRRRYWAKRCA